MYEEIPRKENVPVLKRVPHKECVQIVPIKPADTAAKHLSS